MTSEFDRLFAIAVAAIFGIYLLRCFAGAALMLCARLPTRWSGRAHELSNVVTPRLVRRILALLIGLTGVAGLAAPAQATGAPDLDRAPAREQTNPSQTAPSVAAKPEQKSPLKSELTVRVKSGDSLWRLAERQLAVASAKRHPSDNRIDHQWRRWFKLNRKSIGPNPNLIRAGMWLAVPPIDQHRDNANQAPRPGVTR